jgi:hypothetical protein
MIKNKYGLFGALEFRWESQITSKPRVRVAGWVLITSVVPSPRESYLVSTMLVSTIGSIKSGKSNFCQFWKIRCSSSFIIIFSDTILADSLQTYFIFLFSFSKCPLLLIKVDFDWDFALNKYSLCANVLTYNHSLQPTVLNDNVNQFKVGLESDKGYFTWKVKTMTLMSHFFCPQ